MDIILIKTLLTRKVLMLEENTYLFIKNNCCMKVDRKVSMDILRMNVATLGKFALGKVTRSDWQNHLIQPMTPLWPNIKNGRREDRKKNKTKSGKEDNHTSGSCNFVVAVREILAISSLSVCCVYLFIAKVGLEE